MPYARFDDRWEEHRKIRRAWRREPAAVALHAMAIVYANRHETDGLLDGDWIEERLSLLPYKPAQRARVLKLLLDLGLFERSGEDFMVHDFLDWNTSSEARAKRRADAKDAADARWSRKASSTAAGSPGGIAESNANGIASGNGMAMPATPRHATPYTPPPPTGGPPQLPERVRVNKTTLALSGDQRQKQRWLNDTERYAERLYGHERAAQAVRQAILKGCSTDENVQSFVAEWWPQVVEEAA